MILLFVKLFISIITFILIICKYRKYLDNSKNIDLHHYFQSGRDTDKFVDIPFGLTKQELPYLKENTAAYLDCKVVNSIDVGTHIMFIAEVVDAEILSDDNPMTYAYYHANVKPKPSADANAPKKGWRCKICGYVYEGEELPADFVCPICKHGVADFEKIE